MWQHETGINRLIGMAHCSCKKKIRHVPLKIIQLKSKTLKIKLKFIWAEFLTQKI
jgi:hypothetical protein